MHAESLPGSGSGARVFRSRAPHALRDFQRDLTERTQAARFSTAAVRHELGFVAAGQAWLIDLCDLSEIMPVSSLTRVPHTRLWFSGLINHRGNVIGVIDFAAFLNGQPASARSTDRLIVLSDRFSYVCALRVSRVSHVGTNAETEISTHAITQVSEVSASAERWAGPIVTHEGRSWRRLNPGLLLADPRFSDATHRN